MVASVSTTGRVILPCVTSRVVRVAFVCMTVSASEVCFALRLESCSPTTLNGAPSDGDHVALFVDCVRGVVFVRQVALHLASGDKVDHPPVFQFVV